jgi:MATE family multidrug resistance protein
MDIIDTIEDLSLVLAIYIFFDTIHGIQSGIIRGLGLQGYGSAYTLFCYYIVGMPLALLLAFKLKLGLKGLWLGYTISTVVLDLGFAVIIGLPNW